MAIYLSQLFGFVIVCRQSGSPNPMEGSKKEQQVESCVIDQRKNGLFCQP